MHSYFVYLISRLALGAFRVIPRPVAGALLDCLSTVFYRVASRYRHIARVNLTIAFPELARWERDEIGVRSFRNTARNLLEVSRMPALTARSIRSLVEYDSSFGLDNFERAQAAGKGILYLTGHFSAWELLPTAHALYGHPLAFITRPLDNVYLERYMQQVRAGAGNVVMPKKKAAREILERLKSGGGVGILMDQNTSLQEGIFADFFGVPAATTTGIALFGLRTDSPVMPSYLTPMRGGKYAIRFLPPLELERTGDTGRDILVNTQRFNVIIEKIIREQPDSWLWGHKRWKNQPPGNPPDLYALSGTELLDFVLSCRRKVEIR